MVEINNNQKCMHLIDRKNNSSFLLRTLSSCIAIPLVLFSIYLGGSVFYILLFFLLLGLNFEWCRILKKKNSDAFFLSFACLFWLYSLFSFSVLHNIFIFFIPVLSSFYLLQKRTFFLPKYKTVLQWRIRKWQTSLVHSAVHSSSSYLKSLASSLLNSFLIFFFNFLNTKKEIDYNNSIVFIVGNIYISFSLASYIYLIGHFPYQLLFWICCLIWIADTSAFVFGKILKGPKLIPFISPNKTWSGFIMGIVIPVAFSKMLAHHLNIEHLFHLSVPFFPIPFPIHCVACLITLLGHSGDLLESYAKRRFNVKDSGTLIPGHGGLLDRLDSLLFVGFFLWLFFYMRIIF
jgi:phosphatidate cytidylyltransferase